MKNTLGNSSYVIVSLFTSLPSAKRTHTSKRRKMCRTHVYSHTTHLQTFIRTWSHYIPHSEWELHLFHRSAIARECRRAYGLENKGRAKSGKQLQKFTTNRNAKSLCEPPYLKAKNIQILQGRLRLLQYTTIFVMTQSENVIASHVRKIQILPNLWLLTC